MFYKSTGRKSVDRQGILKRGCLMLAATLFIFSVPGCGELSETRILHLGHGLDVNHPVHQAMVFMGEQIEEQSEGRLQLRIYPSQQLGSERELVELLQIGSLAITKVSTAVLENFSPDMRVFGLPYLFRDKDHKFDVLDGEIGRELLLSPQEYLLRGLTYYDAGFRSFYTKDRPVQTPEDIVGLKVRVQESVMAIELVNSLGGSPTPISWGELYSALQQGIVDGAENNPPSFHTSRHYEVCNYYTLNEHTAPPDIMIISTRVWESLTEQEQQWVQEAADSSAVYQRQLWEEAEQEAFREVEEAGVEVVRPDKAPFVEATQPIYDRLAESDPDLYGLADRIRAVGQP